MLNCLAENGSCAGHQFGAQVSLSGVGEDGDDGLAVIFLSGSQVQSGPDGGP